MACSPLWRDRRVRPILHRAEDRRKSPRHLGRTLRNDADRVGRSPLGAGPWWGWQGDTSMRHPGGQGLVDEPAFLEAVEREGITKRRGALGHKLGKAPARARDRLEPA